MNKKINEEFQDTVCDNDDYFFRDNEMARADLRRPRHEIDPTFDIDKERMTYIAVQQNPELLRVGEQ